MEIIEFLKKFATNVATIIVAILAICLIVTCVIGFFVGLSALINGVFMWYLPVSFIIGVVFIAFIQTLDEF